MAAKGMSLVRKCVTCHKICLLLQRLTFLPPPDLRLSLVLESAAPKTCQEVLESKQVTESSKAKRSGQTAARRALSEFRRALVSANAESGIKWQAGGATSEVKQLAGTYIGMPHGTHATSVLRIMKSPVRTLVCDDHPIVLLALPNELTRAGFFVPEPVATVRDIIAALHDPEVKLVVTDFVLDEPGDGLQMIGRLHRLRPDVRIIVYSMVDSPPMVQDILSAGASAFVSKACGPSQVIAACQAALAGRRFIAPDALAICIASDGLDAYKSALQRMSPREREVLRLLAQGLSVAEIGQRFQRSPKTVSVQKCTAMRKLGLRQDIELARYLATVDWRDE